MKTRSGNYYECTVKYDKMTEDGMIKKTSETYCVEADTFAGAEKRIIDETSVFSQGEFEVKKIALAAYREVFMNDEAGADALFFKVKLQFIIIDEVTGKEKKTAQNYLVFAKDFNDSLKIIQEVMSSSMMDYVTAQITQSKVLEFFGKEA